MVKTVCICDKCKRKFIIGAYGPYYYSLSATKIRGYLPCDLGEFFQEEYDLCESCFERFREWLNDKD